MEKYLRTITIQLLLFLVIFNTSCDKNPQGGNNNNSNDSTILVTNEFKKITVSGREWDLKKRADITYQLLLYSFKDSDGNGKCDFKGLSENLDYINSLGVSAIWLSPIHPASSYHGYDVLDYNAVNQEYGTMNDFKNLVQEAHKRGIKIYLDYVINHTASAHPWFKAALSSETNPYRKYYIFSENPQNDITTGKIKMIATEGSAGYDSGQWFTATSTESRRYKFTLDWSNSSKPNVTVTKTESVDKENPDTSTEGAKYLYFGDGVCRKFYYEGNNIYTLKTDYSSSWGFLIRTSNLSSWTLGTKYGAKNSSERISEGKPFVLFNNNSSNENVYNITFSDALQYHSHFWTSWFADINYGAAITAENSEAFKAITESAKKWIDAGVDGFRLDAVKHIYHNEYSDENPVFLKKFYDALNTYYLSSHSNNIYMVGEVFSEHNNVAPYYKGLPALFEFSFWWRLKDALNSGKGNDFVKNIISYCGEYSNYRQDYIEATKLSNHDENRACSDLGGSVAKAKVAGAVLLTAGGSPYIYYGEELAYKGTKDGGDINVRQMMDWSAVSSLSSDKNSILSVYRDFAKARNTYPALSSGKMVKHAVYNESNASFPSIAAWYMVKDNEKMLVLHNLGASTVTLNITDILKCAVSAQGSVLLRGSTGSYQVMMESYSSVVFEVK